MSQHRYQPGDVIGRWTVIRHASPVQRPHGGDRLVWWRRVQVRCACGVQRTVLEHLLRYNRSLGCSSRTCMSAHRTRQEIAMWDALREHAEDMQRRADEARLAVADAPLRIAAANAKLDRLSAKLGGQTWRR